MRISEFNGETDKTPTTIKCSWLDLVSVLSSPETSTRTSAECARSKCPCKRSVGAWSPAAYTDGASRCKANVLEVSSLVLDLDHLTEHALAESLASLGLYRRIIHASHSDRVGDRCVRVVLALSQPVSGTGWPRFWNAAIDELGVPVDRHACDASRLYFLTPGLSDATYFFESHEGIELDVAAMLARAPTAASVSVPQSGSIYGPASAALLQRARQRLQEHGPAIEGQGGNAHSRTAWGILVNDYALTEAEARELAIEWNATCVPPWDEDDLFAGPMRSHQSWTSALVVRHAMHLKRALHCMQPYLVAHVESCAPRFSSPRISKTW